MMLEFKNLSMFIACYIFSWYYEKTICVYTKSAFGIYLFIYLAEISLFLNTNYLYKRPAL